jgi:hypothetical protein
LNFKDPVAENLIYNGLNIMFLECTVHTLSVDALFVHHYTSVDITKAVFPAAVVIEKDVKVNIMLFRTLCSIEFQGRCSRKLNLSRSENSIFGIYGP